MIKKGGTGVGLINPELNTQFVSADANGSSSLVYEHTIDSKKVKTPGGDFPTNSSGVAKTDKSRIHDLSSQKQQ